MKTNIENVMEQLPYVAPRVKEFEVRVQKGVLGASDPIEDMDPEDLYWND